MASELQHRQPPRGKEKQGGFEQLSLDSSGSDEDNTLFRKTKTTEVVDQDLNSKLMFAARLIANAKRVGVFSGAGTSAESGIDTFRGATGSWWTGWAVGPIALTCFGTPFGWCLMPPVAFTLYNKFFRKPILAADPNPGHRAIAELERVLGPDTEFLVMTQNVDGLHQRGGSNPEQVVEVHGTILKHRCVYNGHPIPDVDEKARCPTCGGWPRPDCTLFCEGLPEEAFTRAARFCKGCREGDVMLVIGTSMLIYPAAGLPLKAAKRGASLIEVNIAESEVSHESLLLKGPGGQVLPTLVEMVKDILSDRRAAAQRGGKTD